jgi:hypothetical protein
MTQTHYTMTSTGTEEKNSFVRDPESTFRCQVVNHENKPFSKEVSTINSNKPSIKIENFRIQLRVITTPINI